MQGRLTRLSLLSVLLPTLIGCATSSIVDTALHGDLRELKQRIKTGQQTGALERDEVEELALAVMEREVYTAQGPRAAERLRSVRGCAGPLTSILQVKAEQATDAGAEAALILLDQGKLNPDNAIEAHAAAKPAAWRAVAARATSEPEYAHLRHRFIRDPDQRVRRAALAASIEAAAPKDTEILLETARLDPDPLSQSLALRALGAIGGERVSLRVRDLWPRADQATRMSMIEAWAMPNAFQSGGKHELARILESEPGILQIAAAQALLRRLPRKTKGSSAAANLAARADLDLRGLALAKLIAAIAEGTQAEQRLALRVTPIGADGATAAIKASAHSENPEVRVIALARLLDIPAERKAAQQALYELSQADNSVALQARAALSEAGDVRVRAKLRKQLSAPNARHRTLAAQGLLRLGSYSEAATALADNEADVRTDVACTMLASR